MNNKITELVFILDASGSMHSLTDDTIGGFNAMIEKHRNSNETVYISTVLFNTNSSVIHDRVRIAEVEPLTRDTYCCNGCTALLDALGDAIKHIGNIHKYARDEDVPGKTLFIVTTDGMENASRRYSSDDVKQLIRREEEKYGWEFIFLGANIDSVETARRYGIREARAVNYVSDPIGTEAVFAAMNRVVDCSINRCKLEKSGWRDGVDADFKARGKKPGRAG